MLTAAERRGQDGAPINQPPSYELQRFRGRQGVFLEGSRTNQNADTSVDRADGRWWRCYAESDVERSRACNQTFSSGPCSGVRELNALRFELCTT